MAPHIPLLHFETKLLQTLTEMVEVVLRPDGRRYHIKHGEGADIGDQSSGDALVRYLGPYDG